MDRDGGGFAHWRRSARERRRKHVRARHRSSPGGADDLASNELRGCGPPEGIPARRDRAYARNTPLHLVDPLRQRVAPRNGRRHWSSDRVERALGQARRSGAAQACNRMRRVDLRIDCGKPRARARVRAVAGPMRRRTAPRSVRPIRGCAGDLATEDCWGPVPRTRSPRFERHSKTSRPPPASSPGMRCP